MNPTVFGSFRNVLLPRRIPLKCHDLYLICQFNTSCVVKSFRLKLIHKAGRDLLERRALQDSGQQREGVVQVLLRLAAELVVGIGRFLQEVLALGEQLKFVVTFGLRPFSQPG